MVGVTYPVRATVSTKVGWERNSSAEAEKYAQTIHDHIDDGNGELVDECCGEEVQQSEQPPYTNEKCVIDDRVCSVSGARDVIAGHCCNDNSTEQLSTISKAHIDDSRMHEPGRREGPYPIHETPC
jgi:hypothetical protein